MSNSSSNTIINKEMSLNQQNIKLIQNYLFQPSIITLTKSNFYDNNLSRFNSIIDVFNEFKFELKDLSCNLNGYMNDKEIKAYSLDIDPRLKSMGMDITYCLKEFCLYSYVDKYITETYPSILEKISFDPDITEEEVSDFLKDITIFVKKLKKENRFNLIDYLRGLKNVKKCKLSLDFFEIFILCPNFFELTKRELSKKISIILEIDCVTNNVDVENFINYYYIFRFGNLVTLEKKLLFINKFLRIFDEKGGPLQEKIFTDAQYLFKIDNRTKQILLGRPYEIKLNFHMTLKIKEVFNYIVEYFCGNNIDA